MSNHAPDEIDQEMADKFKEFYKMGGVGPTDVIDQEMADKLEGFYERGEVGPTNKFPEGKLTEKDEGEYRFMMAVIKNKVVINFGKPIAWIAMDRDEAFGLAKALRKHAKKIT